MSRSKRYSVAEVISMLEEDDDFQIANIFMLPPEDPTRSDEDSGPEDDDGDMDNLTGNQLRADAEATVTVSSYEQKRIGILCEDESTEEEQNLIPQCSADEADEALTPETIVPPVKRARTSTTTLPQTRVFKNNQTPKVTRGKKAASPERQWVKTDIREPDLSWTASQTNTGTTDLSPASLFELFFDDEVIEHMTSMSNLYASQHSRQLGVTSEEIRLVLSILLISGYVPLVNRRMFWESSEDTHNEAVSSALPLNRFEELLRFLHVCDNDNIDASDKMAKLRPLFDMLNKRFLEHWPVEQHVSVDESMVPYYGRHSSKQFIRGKPIRFGFKVWCLNTRLGYLIQCEPYQGASGSYDANLGLGGSVVTNLMENLPTGVPYKLFVDNFFTSTRLLDHLTTKNISVVGTVRVNRMGKCPLKPVEQLRKEIRGSYDFSLDRKSGMLALRWNDNNVVSMLSNCCGIKPLSQVRRWSAAQKKHIFISQPQMVAQYNRFMGGTDRMDQNIAKLRISIRIKKWWWALFCFTVDVAVQNAWLLYRCTEQASQKPYTLVQFRREVAMTNILKYRNRSSSGRPSRGLQVPTSRRQNIPPEVRYDGQNHFIGHISDGQKRCAACGKKVQRKCTKCNVPLHVNCFERFHTKNGKGNCLLYGTSSPTFTGPPNFARYPGQQYSADQQCQNMYGPSSYYCAGGGSRDQTICQSMECWVPEKRACYVSAEQRAYDGTKCGNHKWCMKGQCESSGDSPATPDTCIYGDYKGQVHVHPEGLMSCYDMGRLRPNTCYLNHTAADCCQTCANIRNNRRQPGCPYGDKHDDHCKAVARKSNCYAASFADTCCDSCNRVKSRRVGCEYGNDADWCSTIMAFNCYQSGKGCCETCHNFYDSRYPGCEYGDRAPWCANQVRLNPETCASESHAKQCCKSCAPYMKNRPEHQVCNDKEPRCSSVAPRDCYDYTTTSTCCSTCSRYLRSN